MNCVGDDLEGSAKREGLRWVKTVGQAINDRRSRALTLPKPKRGPIHIFMRAPRMNPCTKVQ